MTNRKELKEIKVMNEEGKEEIKVMNEEGKVLDPKIEKEEVPNLGVMGVAKKEVLPEKMGVYEGRYYEKLKDGVGMWSDNGEVFMLEDLK